MFDFMSGKKTYILAGIGVMILFARNGLGLEIPGVPADPDWIIHALAFLGLGTTRSAIAKTGGAQ